MKRVKKKSMTTKARKDAEVEQDELIRLQYENEQASRAAVILHYIITEQFRLKNNTMGGALQRVHDLLPRLNHRNADFSARTGNASFEDDIPF